MGRIVVARNHSEARTQGSRSSGNPGSGFRPRVPHLKPWLAFVCLLAVMPGCDGGRGTPSSPDDRSPTGQTSANDPEQQLKPDFETQPLVLFPGQFKDEARVNRFKLGHWAYANLRTIANNFDSSGQMHSYSVDAAGRNVPVSGTDFYADSIRPFSLPQGQQKNLETLVFLPPREGDVSAVNVHVELRGPSGLPVIDSTEPVLLMKPYQHHLIALVQNSDQYKYLKMLDCVQLPRLGAENAPPFYTVVYPTAESPLPLAPNPLAWTTVAYVLWDQIPPEDLDEDQVRALIDWLHFGGQLIVSGPNTLEAFRGSWLEPFLPARSTGSRNLVGIDFQKLNDFWSTRMSKSPERRWELVIPEAAPMLGCQLELQPRGSFVAGAEGLVAESAVGRGRIVVTAFPLSDPRLAKWPCYSNLFNGALLRRPGRKFDRNTFGELTFRWTSDDTSIFDPLLASTLRFAARDLQKEGTAVRSPLALEEITSDFSGSNPAVRSPRSLPTSDSVENIFSLSTGVRDIAADPWHYGGFDCRQRGGVAAWNDEQGVASAAREQISLSAGISPPSPTFVLQMLGVYWLILVPVNWFLFWVIGKVEWAWIAAPLISIGGALLVVKLASLDIGFVRSQSQIGLLEVYAGHSRGHLAEYSALYTSLSTRYEVRFEDTTGLALPFKSQAGKGVRTGRMLRPVYLERTVDNRLRDFLIQSNTTGMLHNENVLDLGGSFEWQRQGDQWQLSNGSQFDLLESGIVGRDSEGQWLRGWVGDLAAGSQVEVKLERVGAENLFGAWKESRSYLSTDNACQTIWQQIAGGRPAVTIYEILQVPELKDARQNLVRYFRNELEGGEDPNRSVAYAQFKLAYLRIVEQPSQRLGLGEMFDVLAEGMAFGPGEIRLLGRTESRLGQHVLKPEATQSSRSTLVVVHLQRPSFPAVQSDQNTLLDFLGKSDLDWMQEFEDETDDPLNSGQDDNTSGDTGSPPGG